jgi:hypothetical protein
MEHFEWTFLNGPAPRHSDESPCAGYLWVSLEVSAEQIKTMSPSFLTIDKARVILSHEN